jgi:hypothetical protein
MGEWKELLLKGIARILSFNEQTICTAAGRQADFVASYALKAVARLNPLEIESIN